MMKTRTTVHTLLLPALCAVYLDIGTVEGHDVDADDWSKIGVRSDVTVLMQHFLKVDECLLSLEAMCTSDVFRQFVSELLLGTFFYFSDGMRKLTEVHELAASRDSGAGWSSRSPAEVHRLKQVMQQSSRGAKVRARAPVTGGAVWGCTVLTVVGGAGLLLPCPRLHACGADADGVVLHHRRRGVREPRRRPTRGAGTAVAAGDDLRGPLLEPQGVSAVLPHVV